MNIVEINSIKKIIVLVDEILEGKVEHLPLVKEVKYRLEDLIEFKDFNLTE